MKCIYFSLLIAFCVALIKADGTAYEATWYGGPHDKYRDRNPSCQDSEFPDTKYYAAVVRIIYIYIYILISFHFILVEIWFINNLIIYLNKIESYI